MIIKQNRIKTVLVGFVLLIIPIIYFKYNLNQLYDFSKYKIQENLRQQLLTSANKIESNLDPVKLLTQEFSEIHSELLSDCPEEIIEGIPEESFIKNLYNQKIFEQLIAKTVTKFAPIVIIYGNNNAETIKAYFSPELESSFLNIEERTAFFYNISYFFCDLVRNKYEDYYNKQPYAPILTKYKPQKHENDPCYKYISRFKSLNNNFSPIYTDYFGKQTLYPVLKYTISRKGIHGFYALLIPQSHINPKKIIEHALSDVNPNVKVTLEKDKIPSRIKETHSANGYEYGLNISTDFINHVKAFKRLQKDQGENDYTNYLLKQFKLSIDYPQDLIRLKKLDNYVYLSIPILCLLYFFIAIFILKTKKNFNILITQKLTCILAIIIMLPITAIMISTQLSINNIDEIITYNTSKSLHNLLEIHRIQDQENNLRRIASIFELKKRISKNELYADTKDLNNSILSTSETGDDGWFFRWYNGLIGMSDESDLYYFTDRGITRNILFTKKQADMMYYQSIFSRYLNNLGIVKKTKTNRLKEITQSFSLGILEKYFPKEQEEKSIPQESIPSRDILAFTKLDSAVFFLTKDKNKTNYLFYSKKTSDNTRPYDYIDVYTEKKDSLWFKPNNKFAEINLSLSFRPDSDEKRKIWPCFFSSNKDINNIINLSSETKDSGNEKIKTNNMNIIKEWMITDDEPLVLVGQATIKKDSTIGNIIDIAFITLIIYALILLFLLTKFISIFINKPIQIYKEAIDKLTNNQYGTTIKSFSKDEFDNITKAFNEMSIAIKQKEQIKRYVSEKLIESVKENNVQNAGEGKAENLTVLSSDIRNFTGISEMYEPSVIVEMLNTYFTQMQKAISDNGGIIDKYIGDAIQAVFYDEPQMENQVIRAAKAAITMRKALEEYNKNRKESGLFTIQNGIGIDTDIAITGTIGTTKGRKDFSVNGDVIARAANLEAKTKETESKILISKNSLKKLDCHSNKNVCCDVLLFKDFDEESVELIDVRE